MELGQFDENENKSREASTGMLQHMGEVRGYEEHYAEQFKAIGRTKAGGKTGTTTSRQTFDY